jgi:hypothetical protein
MRYRLRCQEQVFMRSDVALFTKVETHFGSPSGLLRSRGNDMLSGGASSYIESVERAWCVTLGS